MKYIVKLTFSSYITRKELSQTALVFFPNSKTFIYPTREDQFEMTKIIETNNQSKQDILNVTREYKDQSQKLIGYLVSNLIEAH